ncbi:MAG: metalloregulator ArsR/SmtB family transcription factor [Opitutae bacterium]|nr:metalloregulator ArsR/SmtB family transcription factor [Opitutae bacterium]
MKLVEIYESLQDLTRLRVLQLLVPGPLCVCHFQAILGEPQVKISKHLAYLRARGLVQCKRQGNWMIYRLPARPSRALQINLTCLEECTDGVPLFMRDRARLAKLAPRLGPRFLGGCDDPRRERGAGCAAPSRRRV